MDRTWIDRYEAGGSQLRRAVESLNREDVRARPGPGLWSILEVVIHLVDSDAIAIDRMKRILTEENPTLLNADESAYVERLCCDEQSLEDALILFEVGRRQFARVLRRLPEDAFERRGTHNQRGRMTLEDLVTTYVQHLDHHLEFVLAKRANLGKSLP